VLGGAYSGDALVATATNYLDATGAISTSTEDDIRRVTGIF